MKKPHPLDLFLRNNAVIACYHDHLINIEGDRNKTRAYEAFLTAQMIANVPLSTPLTVREFQHAHWVYYIAVGVIKDDARKSMGLEGYKGLYYAPDVCVTGLYESNNVARRSNFYAYNTPINRFSYRKDPMGLYHSRKPKWEDAK